MYSKATAASTTMTNRIMRPAFGCGSGVLQDHLQNDVAGVAAAVDDFFQELVEVPQENDLLRVILAVVKIVEQFQLQLVRIAFDGLQSRVHLAGARDVGAFPQFLYHREDGFRGLIEQVQMFLETASVQVSGKNQDPLADFLDRLGNFVERRGERLDVFAFERRDERLTKLLG